MMRDFSLLNKLLFLLTILAVGLLLLSCIVPYTSIAGLSFLSLVVPLLVIVNTLFLIYWLLKKNKIFLLSGMVLLLGYFALGSFVEIGNKEELIKESSLSIMSYNAMGFGGYKVHDRGSTTREIKAFLKDSNPDVLCFQEFDVRQRKANSFEGYPYLYFYGGNSVKESRVRQAVLSKYPIIGKGSLDFPKSLNNGIFVDVKVHKDTIRIYNLHLESLKIRPGMIKREQSDKLFKRLSYSFSKQQEQAEIFRKHVDANTYKKIVCGDFNNTQFSNVYRIIKDDMLDTFTEKGSGYGKTLNFWRFPLRIDFIFSDPEFEVLSHENFELNLSDHEPVMASFEIKTNK